MKKMVFIFVFLLMVACTPVKTNSPTSNTPGLQAEISVSKKYNVHQQINLVNQGDSYPEQQNLWVALIQSIPPYQEVLASNISPDSYTLVIDEYKNRYAEFDFSEHAPGSTITVDIEYSVLVNELDYQIDSCNGELPDEYTSPEMYIESANSHIVSKAEELAKKSNTCEKVRTFYDFVSSELTYSYNREDWGAQAALGGFMGSDCTEYASLMIALCRAENIPARYYEGLIYLGNSDTEIARTEHAWLDVYLPGTGWTAMDPTLGRSANKRDHYFAHHTANHIVVTMGRNPSTLRGSSYWTHLYWPGKSTTIRLTDTSWEILPVP